MEATTEFHEYISKRVQPSTAKIYLHVLRMWFAWLDGRIPSQGAAQEYVDLLIKKNMSPSTVNLRAHAIMRWFKWRGAPIGLDLPQMFILKGPEYLKLPQIEKLIAVSTTVLERTLVTVLFDTAVRISELLNLELDDIEWDSKILTVTRKGGRKEEVNISDKALEVLSEWLEARAFKSKLVFANLAYWDAWDLLKKLGKRAGIKVHPHIFRHSRAIHMLRNGADLNDVKQHLGHKSIATTINIYGRFTAADLRERVPSW